MSEDYKSRLLSIIFSRYTSAVAANVENREYELEYIAQINKTIYDNIINGKYKHSGLVSDPATAAKYNDLTQSKGNFRKIARYIVHNNNKTELLLYTKQRIAYSAVSDKIGCALSVEISRDVNLDEVKNMVSPTQQTSTRVDITFNGQSYTLIESLFVNGLSESVSNYRIEFEATPKYNYAEWYSIYRQLILLVKIADGASIVSDSVIQYFNRKLETSYSEVRDMFSNPVSFTSKLNHTVNKSSLLGTIKLDGYLGYIACIADPVVGKKGVISFGGVSNDLPFDYDAQTIDMVAFFEYMVDSHTAWFFDVVYFDGVSLIDIENEERIRSLEKMSMRVDSLLKHMITNDKEMTNKLSSLKVRYKTFLDMSNENNFDILTNYKDEPTDGIMLYHKSGTYSKSKIYKNKPAHLNTVDLLVHVVSNDGSGNKNSVILLCILDRVHNNEIKNRAYHTELNKITMFNDRKNFNSNMIPVILHIAPHGNIGVTSVSECDYETKEMREYVVNGGSLDVIIECIWQNDARRWKFIKVRSDKKWPNAKQTVLDNFELSVNAITKELFYNPNFLYYKFDKDAKYESVRRFFSASIAIYIKGASKRVNLINNLGDIACGVGGRMNVIADLKVKKTLWFWDIISAQLEQTKERFDGRKDKLGHLTSHFRKLDFTNTDEVNAELTALTKIKGWVPLDFCFSIYAIHYIFGSSEDMRTFGNFLNNATSDNALFITNIIDMETALPYVNNKKIPHNRYNIVTPDTYNLDEPFNNIFDVSLIYKSNDESEGVLQYNKEPTLTSKTLIAQMKNIGWILIDQSPANVVAKDVQLYDSEDMEWVKHHKFFTFQKSKK